MGLTSAQRHNRMMDKIFETAKEQGAIDDKVTCIDCMKVFRSKDVDIMGRCKICRKKNLNERIKLNWKEDIGF